MRQPTANVPANIISVGTSAENALQASTTIPSANLANATETDRLETLVTNKLDSVSADLSSLVSTVISAKMETTITLHVLLAYVTHTGRFLAFATRTQENVCAKKDLVGCVVNVAIAASMIIPTVSLATARTT